MENYFIHDGIQLEGPFTVETLQNKNLKRYTLVWKEGMNEWKEAGDINELCGILSKTPPSLPPKTIPSEPKLVEQYKIEADGFFEVYSEATKTIRVWFVTFGIGGLYLLLTTIDLLTKLKSENQLKTISILFLIGIGVQLFVAILNKWINWINYNLAGETKPWYGKVANWLSRQFWIDVLADIITAYCYGKIIWLMINIFNK